MKNNKNNKKNLTYKDSGVDIEAGYRSIDLIKKQVKETFTEGVMSDIGGFGGMFSLKGMNMEEPVLISGTDGVGTKLMIAFKMDKHDTIGQDLVAMSVNDVICQGAKPLFFLDYIATANNEPEKIKDIVKGISEACIKSKAALIGGETAEMPGLYKEDEYDLAGFCVGIVDKKNIITGENIKDGDILIGLPSTGIHSNGYSLVRKVFFDMHDWDVDRYVPQLNSSLGEELLKPTQIYVDVVLSLIDRFNIKGISHITGGGFYENIPRMLPEAFSADIYLDNIKKPPIFDLIQRQGNIEEKEMYSTFNMGVGLVMAVNKEDVEDILREIKKSKYDPLILGKVVKENREIKLCQKRI